MAKCRICGEKTDDPGEICWRCSTLTASRAQVMPEEHKTGSYPVDPESSVVIEVAQPKNSPLKAIVSLLILAAIGGILYLVWLYTAEPALIGHRQKMNMKKVEFILHRIKREIDTQLAAGTADFPEELEKLNGFSYQRLHHVYRYYSDDSNINGVDEGKQMILVAIPTTLKHGNHVMYIDESNNVFEATLANEEARQAALRLKWEEIDWTAPPAAGRNGRLAKTGLEFCRYLNVD